MKTYLWCNRQTGEERETTSWSTPPDESGNWTRKYIVGIGRVQGAGGSPARQVKGEVKGNG